MNSFKDQLLKSTIFVEAISRIKRYLQKRYLIKATNRRHAKKICIIKQKEKIKVVFFLIHHSVWKYEGLYALLKNDERFEPLVVVCPYITYGEDMMKREMDVAYDSFYSKSYNVVKSFNPNTGEWLDVKKIINPDIVFFTNPHKLTKDQYCIEYWKDTLTCYVPYAFVIIHLLKLHYDQLFHHLLWRHFCETTIHKQFALTYTKTKKTNVRVTGFPGLDSLFSENFEAVDIWKIKDRRVKKIIWAPHHTIDEDKEYLSYSNFIEYSQLMLDLLEENQNKFQMAFKPHPILKAKLYEHSDWGVEKTNTYYNLWDKLPNGQLEEGEYIDLFATSDAMIMDSASFMVEYLYTGNPIMFMVRDEGIPNRFNEFGKIVFNHLYQGRDQHDVIEFIKEIVVEEKDVMGERRNHFFQTEVLPENGKLASENIYNELVKELC